MVVSQISHKIVWNKRRKMKGKNESIHTYPSSANPTHYSSSNKLIHILRNATNERTDFEYYNSGDEDVFGWEDAEELAVEEEEDCLG